MATIKSFTSLEQSRKLADILPIESADMYYFRQIDNDYFPPDVESICPIPLFKNGKEDFNYDIPCWSLAALLGVASTYCNRLEITLRADKNYNIFAVSGDFVFRSFDDFPDGFDTPIDACYEIILKLHELKML